MSTFKVQPVYAELLMGWLDASTHPDSPHTMKDVLRTMEWNLKGGRLHYDPSEHRFRSDHSMIAYPHGLTLELAELDDTDPRLEAVSRHVKRRLTGRRVRLSSAADWTWSFCYTRAYMRRCQEDGMASGACISGLAAVYRVCRSLWESCYLFPDTKRYDFMAAYTRESVLASASGSHLDVPTCSDIVSSVTSMLRTSVLNGLMQVVEAFDRVLADCGSEGSRGRARRNGRALLSGEVTPDDDLTFELPVPTYQVGHLKFTALHGCAVTHASQRVLVLSRSDLIRVHQFLTAASSGLYATVVQAAVAPGAERLRLHEVLSAYVGQVELLLAVAGEAPIGEEVHVCKAFKRAFSAYLGELSGPLCERETAELWDEAASTLVVKRSQLIQWVENCRNWSAGTSFNLGKVYKLCPAPDACPILTLIDRHNMVMNRNVPDPVILPQFEVTLRDQILRAYIRTPGVKLETRAPDARPTWWDDYQRGNLDMVPTAQIHQFLEWEGTADMPDRSPHDPSAWKDSGLGWDDFETAIDPDRDPKHGNMLTRAVFDSNAPQPGTYHIQSTHHHKIDTKPEGYKEPARGIYSGNLKDRLNQSWMEVAVERVSRNHPSFMIGAAADTHESRVRSIVSRCREPNMVDLYYSFDISGWSPKMPPETQRISHKIWGELYDSDMFRSAHQINENALIYMNKAGYLGWFVNTGANLEGYNGKEMTMILVALMALAVTTWRTVIVERGHATRAEAGRWAAILLAYIDDGLAKLTLPRDRAVALFTAYKDTTVSVFARCGYTVEKCKCYPSDRFAIFLNEPYLGGRHVTHGTRAAMTICAENTEQHTTLLERASSVSTGCRGAVMAGLDALTGSMLQAYHVFKHVREWVRYPDPTVAALWSFAPRAWGGLGLPTALQLGTTGGGSASEEGIQTIQSWAQISMPARVFFLKACREQLAKRTHMGMMTSPLGGRLPTGPMIESRVPEAVRDALTTLRKEGRISNLAREFLGYSSAASMSEYASRVLSGGEELVLQEQLLNDLASAHPHAIFSAFARRIDKSSTLMSLVGRRAMNRIIKDNRRDATASYRAVRMRASG